MAVRQSDDVRLAREVKVVNGAEANGARVDRALLIAVTIVTAIAALGTAGSKALARWVGAE